MWENIKILNLSQQNKEKTIGAKIKLSSCKCFHRKSVGNLNEKKEGTNG